MCRTDHAGDVQRLAAAVALEDAGDLDRSGAFVLHAAQAQGDLQAQADLCQDVGQPFFWISSWILGLLGSLPPYLGDVLATYLFTRI